METGIQLKGLEKIIEILRNRHFVGKSRELKRLVEKTGYVVKSNGEVYDPRGEIKVKSPQGKVVKIPINVNGQLKTGIYKTILWSVFNHATETSYEVREYLDFSG